MLPFVEYLTEFESKFRITYYSLLLSNLASLGTLHLEFFFKTIFKSLETSVEFIRSIISLIESTIEPEVYCGTKHPS